ncbi:WD40/YVTN repeat-like-containing domain-containing protein [Artemisia annua]|uniref:WD40/YVTN repeat-like-containing domain-containing protein n=1 Tax=Artemisia annua TaxID=35608 RepID=A0A2U1KSN7_ARTAN|nr:WD40/YVTN repeat-like-containing domain-containing protein [Artemisia annua]
MASASSSSKVSSKGIITLIPKIFNFDSLVEMELEATKEDVRALLLEGGLTKSASKQAACCNHQRKLNELRNVVWATSKNDIHLMSNYSIMHGSSLSQNLNGILNFFGHVPPTEYMDHITRETETTCESLKLKAIRSLLQCRLLKISATLPLEFSNLRYLKTLSIVPTPSTLARLAPPYERVEKECTRKRVDAAKATRRGHDDSNHIKL